MDQPAWTESDEDSRPSSTASSKLGQSFGTKMSLEDDLAGFVEVNSSSEEDAEMVTASDSERSPMIIHAETTANIEIIKDEDDEVARSTAKPSSDSDDESVEEVEQACQRYFLEKSGPKCFNCGEPGHMSRDCKAANSLPCFLCGMIGHQRSNCPEEICHNCGRPGHMSRDCRQPRKRRMTARDICSRCGGPGHHGRECSLNWRKYVLDKRFCTGRLDPRKIEVAAATICRVCYNCAGLDHFGDECPYERKRPDWTIFHEPNAEFLDLATLRSSSSQSSRQPTSSSSSSNSHRRSDDRHQSSRQGNPSPNWKELRQSAIVTEDNYYKHFDGSYSGTSQGGKKREPDRRDRTDSHRSDAKRRSPQPSSSGSKYKGGYKSSKSSKK